MTSLDHLACPECGPTTGKAVCGTVVESIEPRTAAEPAEPCVVCFSATTCTDCGATVIQ
jgi:hypothetical protein